MFSRLLSRNGRRTKRTPPKTRPRFRPYFDFLENRITPNTGYLPAALEAGSLTSGLATVTVASTTSPTVLFPGEFVTGTGIQSGTTISQVNSPTQITLTNKASAGGSQQLTFSVQFNETEAMPGFSATSATVAIASASESSSTVTITLANAPASALLVGQPVQISGVGVAGYNGNFNIASVPSSTTFTYTDSNAGLAASGGGIASVATVQAFYTDEHALTLGANTITMSQNATQSTTTNLKFGGTTTVSNCALTAGSPLVIVPSNSGLSVGESISGTGVPTGTTISATSSNPVQSMSGNPAHFANPTGSSAGFGDPNVTDPFLRPIYPALSLTDTTANPLTTSGTLPDGTVAQFGRYDYTQVSSTALLPNDVFGTWKAAEANDPSGNSSLGTGADPNPFSNLSQGYQTEMRYSINTLIDPATGQHLIAGHKYRFLLLDHDGDQNKTGGDAGFSVFYYTPSALTTTPNNAVINSGHLNDRAMLTVSQAASGTLTFKLFAPGNNTTPVYTDVVTVNGPGTYSTATMGNNAGGYVPTTVGTYQWQSFFVPSSSDTTDSGAVDQGGSGEQGLAEEARILINPPTATNAVGTNHTLTAEVDVSTNGTTWTAEPGVTVNFSLLNNAAGATFVGASSGTTAANGQTTAIIVSNSPGGVDIQATTTFTISGVDGTFSRTTGDSFAGDTSNAHKTFEDARILINPPTATNAVGTNHTLTAEVDVTTDGSHWTAEPGVTVNFSLLNNAAGATFVGASSGTTGSNGQTTAIIVSNSPGGVDIQATTTFTIAGVGGSFTRTTGDSFAGDTSNAHKTFEDARILINPPTATNAVGTNHTLTAEVDVTTDPTRTSWTAEPGVTVNFSLLNNAAGATFVGASSGTTGSNGQTTAIIVSNNPGGVDIQAATTFTITGVGGSFTRTTGDSFAGDSSNAHKTFEDARILINPPTATNAVGTNHTLTAEVDVTTDGSHWTAEPGVTVNFSLLNNAAGATFVGASSGTTGSNGQTTAIIVSNNPGGVDIQATTTFTISGVGGSFTRTTGDTFAGDSSNAHKTYEDARIQISPLIATNVVGTNHTLTATVQVTADPTRTSWTAEPGVTVNFSLLNNAAGASFVAGVNSGTTDGNGHVSVQIVSANPGSVNIQATTTFIISGVGGSFTRTTGDSFVGDSANAIKYYEQLLTADNTGQATAGTTAVSDTATLAGANNPNGTITFQLLNSSNTAVFTSTATVNGNGPYTSGSFTPTVPGVYNWKASYGADTNGNPDIAQESNFGQVAEKVTVSQVDTHLTTLICPSPGVVVNTNTAMKDAATLTQATSGAPNPTGTITFYLFAPGVTPNSTNFVTTPPTNFVYKTVVTLSGSLASPATVNTGMGNNPVDGFVPTVVGTYNWAAAYSGDTANKPAQSVLEPDLGIAQAPVPPYPLTTTGATPLQKVAFNESTALPGFRFDPTTGRVEVFYTDEHALLLGVNSVTVDKTATLPAKSNTITVNTASQGGTASLLVGDSVVGSNIPTGTVITFVGSGSVTLSNATTNTAAVTETVAFTTAAGFYPVSPTPSTVAGSAIPPQVGAPYYTPAQLVANGAPSTYAATTITPLQLALGQAAFAPVGNGPGATDPSGRPNFFAGFLTDVTGLGAPATGANDWQNGGSAQTPSALYGTWKTATETINLVTSSVSLSLASDPTANGTNLDGGDTYPSSFSHEGYTAEAVFKLSDLRINGQPLIEGHTYRLYMIDHDGDQNKTGGDSGQAAFDFTVPCTDELTAASTPAAQSLAANPVGFGRVVPGVYTVSVDGLQGPAAQAEQARIVNAIAQLNTTLAPFGVTLIQVGSASADANVHLRVADATSAGGSAQGVLGALEFGDTVTLVNGWNWYTGSDPSQIGSNQYDFQTIVEHELGHVVGIDESADPSSVMYGILAPGQVRRDLSTSDMTLIHQQLGIGQTDGSSGSAASLAATPSSTPEESTTLGGSSSERATGNLAATPLSTTEESTTLGGSSDERATDNLAATPLSTTEESTTLGGSSASHERTTGNLTQTIGALVNASESLGFGGAVSSIVISPPTSTNPSILDPRGAAITISPPVLRLMTAQPFSGRDLETLPSSVWDQLFQEDDQELLQSGFVAEFGRIWGSDPASLLPGDAVWQAISGDFGQGPTSIDGTKGDTALGAAATALPAATESAAASAWQLTQSPPAWAWAAFLGGLASADAQTRSRRRLALGDEKPERIGLPTC